MGMRRQQKTMKQHQHQQPQGEIRCVRRQQQHVGIRQTAAEAGRGAATARRQAGAHAGTQTLINRQKPAAREQDLRSRPQRTTAGNSGRQQDGSSRRQTVGTQAATARASMQ